MFLNDDFFTRKKKEENIFLFTSESSFQRIRSLFRQSLAMLLLLVFLLLIKLQLLQNTLSSRLSQNTRSNCSVGFPDNLALNATFQQHLRIEDEAGTDFGEAELTVGLLLNLVVTEVDLAV